jgi:hypothetical protein
MTERTRRLSRRSFVLALGAATAATAAAIATKGGAQVPASGKAPGAKRGYQASAHVGSYYRTTRL